eukprot:6200768-Prymnesium_polylepis.1
MQHALATLCAAASPRGSRCARGFCEEQLVRFGRRRHPAAAPSSRHAVLVAVLLRRLRSLRTCGGMLVRPSPLAPRIYIRDGLSSSFLHIDAAPPRKPVGGGAGRSRRVHRRLSSFVGTRGVVFRLAERCALPRDFRLVCESMLRSCDVSRSETHCAPRAVIDGIVACSLSATTCARGRPSHLRDEAGVARY